MQKPRQPNENDPKPTDNDLVFSDIHGDFEGLIALLKKAKWNPDNQRLFNCGDNVDRGHQPKEVLDFVRKYGVVSILSNHDYFHYRYAVHEIQKMETKKKNPMHLSPEKKNTFQQFKDLDEYISYMLPIIDEQPLYLPFEVSWGKGYLLHGGIDPFNPIEKQEPEKILVRRYHPSPSHFLQEETDEYQFWQKSYNGSNTDGAIIIHGHMPCPSVDYYGNPLVFSLDGGGVMGKYSKGIGVHRLMRFLDKSIIEVHGSKNAVKNYKKLRK